MRGLLSDTLTDASNTLVLDSVREFAKPEYGVDLFKLEAPLPGASLPAPDGSAAHQQAQPRLLLVVAAHQPHHPPRARLRPAPRPRPPRAAATRPGPSST